MTLWQKWTEERVREYEKPRRKLDQVNAWKSPWQFLHVYFCSLNVSNNNRFMKLQYMINVITVTCKLRWKEYGIYLTYVSLVNDRSWSCHYFKNKPKNGFCWSSQARRNLSDNLCVVYWVCAKSIHWHLVSLLSQEGNLSLSETKKLQQRNVFNI